MTISCFVIRPNCECVDLGGIIIQALAFTSAVRTYCLVSLLTFNMTDISALVGSRCNLQVSLECFMLTDILLNTFV